MIESREHNGYTIEIHQDICPINPWEFGDCEPPILVAMNDSPRDYAVSGYGLDDSTPALSDEFVREHWAVMLGMMGRCDSWLDLLQFAREYCTDPGDLVDVLREEFEEHVADARVEDRFEAIAQCYCLQGVSATVKPIRGHCQGDFGLVLAVATHQWVEMVGVPADLIDGQLRDAAKLFEDYAFGNVYGFVVRNPEGEEVHSCWGYFGDPDESGLIDDAQSHVDADIPDRADRLAFESRAREEAARVALAFNDSRKAETLSVTDTATVEADNGGAWVTARLRVQVK